MKNLVDTWLRQALTRLPESLVPPDAALRDARVALVSAVGVGIRNGLRLLGGAAPESV